MAHVTTHDNPTDPIAENYPLAEVLVLGAILGLLFWGISFLVNYYIVDQILCRSSNTLSACLNSTTLSGSITTILVGAIGILLMIRLRITQPIVVAVGSAVVLWTLNDWTAGLSWFEVALWTILLYVISYVLFTWITRYKKVLPVMAISLVIVIVIRLILAA